MKSNATTVAEYVGELPAERQAALKKVRSLIRKAGPKPTESIHYGMPVYDVNHLVCGLASQKNYMALYVCEPEIVDAHRDALGKLNCGKGCIRFRTVDELPLDAISQILEEAGAKGNGA
ncbi:MAG TPA: DUF1801 domain-containing protein [Chthoniobacterales bacterium]|nr:DUF1801 domain-containing protein [Chthoniobacterales bacterium]